MDACGLGPRACNVIAELVYQHPLIRVLSLSGNTIGDLGCAAFADLLLQSERIIALDLSSNSIGDHGASTIFQSIGHNKSIYSLRLGSTSAVGRNSFGMEAIIDLEQMLIANKTLAELDLSMSEITADHVDVFARGMQVNHNLEVLILANNNIQSRGAATVLAACAHSRIQELNLAGNHMADDVGPAFAKFLHSSSRIRVLNLSGNNLTARFTAAIAGPLAGGCGLEELDLSGNPIGGRGASAIKLAGNKKLRVLSLAHCKIEAAGFGEFCADVAKNSALVRVSFAHNPLRDEGAMRFAAVLPAHSSLREVDLELCEISDPGAEALFPALAQSPSVDRFSVKNNLIRNGLVIQKAVADNPRLLSLNVEYNDIDFKVFTEIQRLVRVNQKAWRDGQKQRIEDACVLKAQVEIQLAEVRASIYEERQTIALLQKKLVDTQDYRVTSEAD
jgi:Ran GTPase-activating protein (RanGAP) involved in mRNA processing and transport